VREIRKIDPTGEVPGRNGGSTNRRREGFAPHAADLYEPERRQRAGRAGLLQNRERKPADYLRRLRPAAGQTAVSGQGDVGGSEGTGRCDPPSGDRRVP